VDAARKLERKCKQSQKEKDKNHKNKKINKGKKKEEKNPQGPEARKPRNSWIKALCRLGFGSVITSAT